MVSGCGFSKGTRLFLHVFISLQFIISPALVHAASGDGSSQNSQALNGSQSRQYSVYSDPATALSPEDYLKQETQFSEGERAFIQSYFNLPVRETLDDLLLLRALSEKALQIENNSGHQTVAEQIKSRIKNDAVSVEIPGIGKAKFNSFGLKESGLIFTEVTHYGSNRSLVLIDLATIPMAKRENFFKQSLEIFKKLNPELRTQLSNRILVDNFIAIQQMHSEVTPMQYSSLVNDESSQLSPQDAQKYIDQLVREAANSNGNKTPADTSQKLQKGRDTVVVYYDSSENNEIKNVEQFAGNKNLSPIQKVAVYWRSIFEPPRLNWKYWDQYSGLKRLATLATGDFLIGAISTTGQTIINTGFTLLFTHHLSLLPLAIVTSYGFMIGSNPIYRNWININSDSGMQLFKSFLNSITFNYFYLSAVSLAANSYSFEQMVHNFFFSGAVSFAIHWKAFTDALINNLGKLPWGLYPRMRQRAGLNLREINLGGLETKTDKSLLESQLWYLTSNVFRSADIVETSPLYTTFNIQWTLSRLAMLGSVVIIYPFARYIANKYNMKEKDELNKRWIGGNYLDLRNLEKWNRWILEKMGSEKEPFFKDTAYRYPTVFFEPEAVEKAKDIHVWQEFKMMMNGVRDFTLLPFPAFKVDETFVQNRQGFLPALSQYMSTYMNAPIQMKMSEPTHYLWTTPLPFLAQNISRDTWTVLKNFSILAYWLTIGAPVEATRYAVKRVMGKNSTKEDEENSAKIDQQFVDPSHVLMCPLLFQ